MLRRAARMSETHIRRCFTLPPHQHQLEALSVQSAKHLMKGGHTWGTLPGKPKGLGHFTPRVSAPQADGIQATGSTQHRAHRQLQNSSQRVSPPMGAARVWQGGQDFHQ